MVKQAVFLSLLVAGILFVAVWLNQSDTGTSGAQTASSLVSSSEADLEGLEKAAFDSCMCQRNGGSEAACDRGYSDARDALMLEIYGSADAEWPAGSATACAPVSSETDCFEFSDGTKCISTGFYVNGASRDMPVRQVCTADEALAIEQAYEQGWLGPDGHEPDPNDSDAWSAANERANAAVDETLRRILAGETIAVNEPSSESCVG